MAVGIKVGSITDEIGSGAFLHAFFSTVSGRLEGGWGTRFPKLMQLYKGSLTPDHASMAIAELASVRSELAAFAPKYVIWDIDDRASMPPWGMNISSDITSLADYFVTSTGRDLIELLGEALEAARDEHRTAEIVSY